MSVKRRGGGGGACTLLYGTELACRLHFVRHGRFFMRMWSFLLISAAAPGHLCCLFFTCYTASVDRKNMHSLGAGALLGERGKHMTVYTYAYIHLLRERSACAVLVSLLPVCLHRSGLCGRPSSRWYCAFVFCQFCTTVSSGSTTAEGKASATRAPRFPSR